ncbi:MAG: cupin domain-containing protein [Gemmatimonadetes bacterium]|nr:MAG: cupin domain-containing protein [Gemmatimonadota bacterium]
MEQPTFYEKRNVFETAENYNNGIVNFFMDVDGYECYVLKQHGLHDFRHENDAHDELLFVAQGSATIELNDETIQLATGDMLKIPRGVIHANIIAHHAILILFEMKG